MEELKLIELAKNGDRGAFGEIYRTYLTRIYRFVYYLVNDENLAEDITQDTFIKVWNALPSFSIKKGTMQAYLFRAARNLVIDKQRKKKDSVLTEEIAESAQSQTDLVNEYAQNEEGKLLKSALETLKESEKQIIILRYFEDLSFKEISNVIGKNDGAVRVEVHRILQKLKKHLKK